jgi:post-segregation antitoxin (ccd killing protein)
MTQITGPKGAVPKVVANVANNAKVANIAIVANVANVAIARAIAKAEANKWQKQRRSWHSTLLKTVLSHNNEKHKNRNQRQHCCLSIVWTGCGGEATAIQP